MNLEDTLAQRLSDALNERDDLEAMLADAEDELDDVRRALADATRERDEARALLEVAKKVWATHDCPRTVAAEQDAARLAECLRAHCVGVQTMPGSHWDEHIKRGLAALAAHEARVGGGAS